jgi:hypothetical protein
MTERRLHWVATDGDDRTEDMTASIGPDGLRATGVQRGGDPPLPYRLHYALHTDEWFRTRLLDARAEGDGWARTLHLTADGAGSWGCETTTEGDADLPPSGCDPAILAGALDCDLAFSPLTNFMPVRRTGLAERPGTADFLMAWVTVPSLEVLASAQRYEHVRTLPGGAVVRFVDRGLFPGFTAELELDADGLIIVYPGLARAADPGLAEAAEPRA